MFLIEQYPLANPNYHQASDTPATLNLELCAGTARAAAAALADLADE